MKSLQELYSEVTAREGILVNRAPAKAVFAARINFKYFLSGGNNYENDPGVI